VACLFVAAGLCGAHPFARLTGAGWPVSQALSRLSGDAELDRRVALADELIAGSPYRSGHRAALEHRTTHDVLAVADDAHRQRLAGRSPMDSGAITFRASCSSARQENGWHDGSSHSSRG
jgi:hypothetical protein